MGWEFFDKYGQLRTTQMPVSTTTHTVRAKQVTGQSIPNNVAGGTAITFDGSDWDTDNFHSNSTNNTRITIPTGLGGTYVLTAYALWPNTSTSPGTSIAIRKNGTTYLGGSDTAVNGGPSNQMLSCVTVQDQSSPGDYYEAMALNMQGSAWTLVASNFTATLQQTVITTANTASLLTPIFDVVVGRGQAGDPASGATTIDTNTILGGSIPQTYRHLEIVYEWRMASGNNATGVMLFNNDSSASYYWVDMDSNGTASSWGTGVGQTSFTLVNIQGPTGPSNGFSSGTIKIPSYSRGDRWKNYTIDGNFMVSTASGGFYNTHNSGLYVQVAALTRIAWSISGAVAFADGSRITMYGMN